jgi:hypothetical protein
MYAINHLSEDELAVIKQNFHCCHGDSHRKFLVTMLSEKDITQKKEGILQIRRYLKFGQFYWRN